jgi:uncharacterized protein (DUF1330 family)
MSRYQRFMAEVKPALESVGARYLARGGTHRVHEGDWQPRRIVLLEFPSMDAFDQFYHGPIYTALKSIRDECSSARLVSVQGLDQSSSATRQLKKSRNARRGENSSGGSWMS